MVELGIRASGPEAVALARRAEERGLDVVVVEPYDDLDPWTLVGWLAGSTARVRLVAELAVGEVPLASVLARAAGSLALLSGGRTELALRGEQAVLAEVVAVLRGLWATGRQGPLTVTGEHHRVRGVERGPGLDREPALWLPADAAPDADLDADGWLLSGPADGPADGLPRWLDTDLAALAAGLPDGVTRAVVPVTSVAEVDAVADLAPTVRRSTATTRRPAVIARRRPGIDYDGIPVSLRATAVEPGDPGHARLRSTYMRGGDPGLVLRPSTPQQVAEALAFADRHRHLPLGIRSGGHGVSGRSTNHDGLVIDLGRLDSVEVLDEARRLVRIGPGATWKQVAAVLDAHDWALGSGDYGGVGVGGLATAGGIGFLGREHGLTIDHLVAAEAVLPSGELVRASATEHPDLFWGLRGAGANLGVVTAFEFEASEVTEVGWAQLTVGDADAAGLLQRFGVVATTAPRDTTIFLMAGPPRDGLTLAQLYGMVDSGDPDTIIRRLTPFAEIAPLYQQQVVIARYADVMAMAPDPGAQGHQARGEVVSRSGFLREVTPEFAKAAAELLASGATYFFQLRTVGGAIADVAPDATAYAHRDATIQVTALGTDPHALDAGWRTLAPWLDGLYLSFETGTGPEQLAAAFPPATLERLRDLKRRYDPTNLLRDNFNIAPDQHGSPA